MNSFNFNRFGKTLRWVLAVNFRNLMMWTIGYCLVAFVGEMMFWRLSIGQNPRIIMLSISNFFTVFILIAICIGISTVFYDLNKKPKREAFLMIPASNLEKFLSAVVYVTVVWTIGVCLSFAVGDTLRMIVRALAYGDEWLSAIPLVAKNLTPDVLSTGPYHTYSFFYIVMELIVIFGLNMWIHSLYLLGGTFLRKYSFVVTSVVMILCFILLSWVITHFNMSLFRSNWNGDTYVSQEVGVLAYVLAVLLPLLSIFNYWASYQIFKGFQLITNKWFNYDFYK